MAHTPNRAPTADRCHAPALLQLLCTGVLALRSTMQALGRTLIHWLPTACSA
jgi:hypothetical protein